MTRWLGTLDTDPVGWVLIGLGLACAAYWIWERFSR